jgi:periplasmic protein TonB
MRNLMLGVSLFAAAAAASAQFANPPTPAPTGAKKVSSAQTPKDYRRDGARHLYAAYGAHIYKGKLPPLLYGVAIIETEIDDAGNVVNVSMVRKPAAPEVGPWVLEMARQAGPYPAPGRMGRVKYLDIWLVHKSGKFQLDTLTEGQL